MAGRANELTGTCGEYPPLFPYELDEKSEAPANEAPITQAARVGRIARTFTWRTLRARRDGVNRHATSSECGVRRM